MNTLTLDFENEQDYMLFQAMLGHGMVELINQGLADLYGGSNKIFEFYDSITKQLPTLLSTQNDKRIAPEETRIYESLSTEE